MDTKEFPNLTYTRDLQDWGEFVRRTPDEYEAWVNGVTKECTVLEIEILKDLVSRTKKKIFVDTNISVEILHEISNENHVLIMLADPNISVQRFFERPDKEKQFLYQLLLNGAFFTLFAELENLVGNLIVGFFVVSLFEKLFLKFHQLSVNAISGVLLSFSDDFSNVLL